MRASRSLRAMAKPFPINKSAEIRCIAAAATATTSEKLHTIIDADRRPTKTTAKMYDLLSIASDYLYCIRSSQFAARDTQKWFNVAFAGMAALHSVRPHWHIRSEKRRQLGMTILQFNRSTEMKRRKITISASPDTQMARKRNPRWNRWWRTE